MALLSDLPLTESSFVKFFTVIPHNLKNFDFQILVCQGNLFVINSICKYLLKAELISIFLIKNLDES